MKQRFFYLAMFFLLCLHFEMSAQVVFRHTASKGNTRNNVTILNHPDLNGNPKAILFILPNWNHNGTDVQGQNYAQNAGVFYNGKQWTIFNQNTGQAMPIGANFNVMIAPPGNKNCFTIKATAASKKANGFPNGFQLNHPAVNGKSEAFLLVTQHREKFYNDASQIVYYANERWHISNNGYFSADPAVQAKSRMPTGARFNVMVIEKGTVPGFPDAKTWMHTATAANTTPGSNFITFLEEPGLQNNKEAILFATAYWGHSDKDRKGGHQAGGPYNDGPLMARYDHPEDVWKHKDTYWSLYNCNSAKMPEGAKIFVVAMSIKSPQRESAWTEVVFSNAKKIDTASLVMEGLVDDGPKRLPVAVVDGFVVFDGDIVIGPEKDYFNRVNGKLVSKGVVKSKNTDGPVKKDAGTPNRNALWPNGIIPFVIQDGHERRNDILGAIFAINQVGSVCLRPRTNEVDFVEFIFDQNSTFSCVSQWIGRRGGRQTINILENCSFGTIQHEILHAVGVFHEHTRADRDEYIRVNWGNIRQNRGVLFQYRREGRTLSACPYDYGSIMHYPLQSFGFAIDPDIDVLTPLRPVPPGVEIGQRDVLSACDAAGLRFLYPGTRGCTIEEDPDLIVFLDQPAYEGLPLGYEQRIVTPTSFPANYVDRPISIDVMQGWVAIITMYCDSEFPTELRVFRDEPNITLPGPVCRIEMVPVVEEKIINIPDFGRRCPMNHARGDGEFAGNGPAIYSSASVWADLNNKIQLRVNFMAAEIGGDRSFVRDEWLRELMAVEPHLQVLAMDRSSSETAGEVPVDGLMLGFRSRPADFELIACNEGQVHTSGSDFQLRGDLIREMQIVGDTGAQDIRSGNCGCDTGIRNIIFNPVRVYLGVRP